MFRLINTKGSYITMLDDWPEPKNMSQWEDGKSAKEFARFWTETHSCGSVPSDYQELLERGFPGIKLQGGRPECTTSLPPRGSRGPRVHDLHLWGSWLSGTLTVCVEAKADEPFDDTISQYKVNAKKELESNPRSRQKERLGDMLDSVWGVRKPTESQYSLRYQLLHALVGTAIQALIDVRVAGTASGGTGVLLIHVFETDKTERHRLEKNRRDLERFAHELPNVAIPETGIAHGCLYGPAEVSVPADFKPLGYSSIVDVYLGKLVTTLT